MVRIVVAVILFASSVFSARAEGTELSAASIFTDHMVLQQSTQAPVWGTGMPGTRVTVRGSWGRSSSALVGADSTWLVKLSTPKAGGPHVLAISAERDTLNFSDVMIGEVWLCSGQSNMEMPLAGWPPSDTILAGAETIRRATIPGLRFFSVKREFSTFPEKTCNGSWNVCSPATVPGLSATAFYFGRRVHRDLKVPVGLIISSWGGTVVDAWTRAGFLSRLPGYDTTLGNVASAGEDLRKFDAWNARFPHIAVAGRPETEGWPRLQFGDSLCASRTYADGSWKSVNLPGQWDQSEIGDFQGAVWFRKTVTIPAAWVHHDLSLALGPIDEMDLSYVNGVKVGGYEAVSAWNTDRVYVVPAALVDSTVLQLAIRVINTYGRGGFCSPAGSMSLRSASGAGKVDLSGAWQYMPVAAFFNDRFIVYGPHSDAFSRRPPIKVTYGPNMPTALYNGMIAPLVPYALSGAIWYQGEADIFRASRYRELLSLLIENWRNDFQRPRLPFYYAQLAPFDYGNRDGSAYLREAQLQTLRVPGTGMAVTIDIGNAKNIHPANKRDVGERLARWALAKTYGRKVPYSGPLYAGMTVRGSDIEIRFDHAEKGLIVTGGMRGSNIFIAGEDRVFRMAEVRVKGSALFVSHPDIARPVAVRYAWNDTPDATVFNTDGLPASSFRTDDWMK